MPQIKQKKLIKPKKKDQQKYFVLHSDHTVFIDNEWAVMKKAVRYGKPIIETLPTDSRLLPQRTNLTMLLENLEVWGSTTKLLKG